MASRSGETVPIPKCGYIKGRLLSREQVLWSKQKEFDAGSIEGECETLEKVNRGWTNVRKSVDGLNPARIELHALTSAIVFSAPECNHGVKLAIIEIASIGDGAEWMSVTSPWSFYPVLKSDVPGQSHCSHAQTSKTGPLFQTRSWEEINRCTEEKIKKWTQSLFDV